MEENLKELLKAENEVNKRVNEALTRKNNLLRSIKENAEKDITAYKAAKEQEYQEEYKRLKKRIEDEGIKNQQEEGAVDMETIQKDYVKNKDSVVDLLVRNVLSVNIEIPNVVKGTF
jgi:vacuolar-type H+-ATPase subunit H